MPPPVATKVAEYDFGATFEATEKFAVADPEPGAEITPEGENWTVTPEGSPVALSVTAASKLEFGVTVTVKLPEAPGAMLIEDVDDARANVGTGSATTERERDCFVEPLAAVIVAE
jgi:hypothetical protein